MHRTSRRASVMLGPLALAAAATLALAAAATLALGACSVSVIPTATPTPAPGAPTATPGAPTATPGAPTATLPSPTPVVLGPPAATPLAEPPPQPASDGTTATIHTAKGDIVIELYTESSPVAAENFANIARSGWYAGRVFHRLVPGFVIQGGSPRGDGIGDAGHSIVDEPIVGRYLRGTVAMARTSAPNSQGSQFFIVLDDRAEEVLASYNTYAIFGRVVEGMDVVDAIAAMPNSGGDENRALEPVAMESVTISRPAAASARPSPKA